MFIVYWKDRTTGDQIHSESFETLKGAALFSLDLTDYEYWIETLTPRQPESVGLKFTDLD